MTKKITALLAAATFAAMPTVCFAQETIDNGPLTAGEPASVHEARMHGIAPATIALISAAVLVTIVVSLGNSSASTGTH